MTDLKEKLNSKEVLEYSWLETLEMVRDSLTKEKTDNKKLDKIVVKNNFTKTNLRINTTRG